MALDSKAYQQAAWAVATGRGEHALKEKKFETARKLFEKVLAKNPSCVRALEGLALTQAGMKNLGEAVRRYREAARAGATDPRTYNNLAWYLCTSGQPTEADLREAVWAARRAVELAPLANFWDTLAEALVRVGDVAGAVAARREAIRIDPVRESFRERIRGLCEGLPIPESAPSRPPSASELILDESTGSSPQGKSDKPDIFETDFEVPSLEDESGSEAVALDEDTDLESDSSDFDLALSDEDMVAEDESGSQVVALEDEEEADEGAATVSRPRRAGRGAVVEEEEEDEESEFAGIGAGVEEEEELAAVRAGQRGAFGPSPVQRDPVDCTVFAPPEAPPGDSLMVQVFAHRPEQAEAARAAALEFDADAHRRGVTSLGTEIERGSKLTFELLMDGLVVDAPVQGLIWRGQPDSVQFEVRVPAKEQARTVIGKVLVSQHVVVLVEGRRKEGKVLIGEVKFKLKVVAAAANREKMPAGEARRFLQAFISYASQDRKQVLERVQMLTAAGIRYFQDVLDLDPGDRWQRELYRHIDESDVLFLFWSQAAKDSTWVAREWQYGLQHKGDDFIRPVIIEGPPIAQPPEELKHLHFNDRVLYFLQAS